MVHPSRRLYRAALLISSALYLAACALPATDIWVIHDSDRSLPSTGTRTENPATPQQGSGYYETVRGITCLGMGWINLFGFEIAWLANPLALIGAFLLIFRRPKGAAAFGAASLGIALLYLLVPPSWDNRPPEAPRLGAWLWLGSFIALTVAALIRRNLALQGSQSPA